jgi:glutamine---fructose-6-phosphate transaminase (isomerizing)
MGYLSQQHGLQIVRELQAMPELIRQTLACDAQVRAIAAKYAHVHNFLYLGRQYQYPVALEGALKIKEITSIHAEGYPAADMEYGSLPLVDRETPSAFLVPRGGVYKKAMNKLEAIKARGGPVIAVASAGDTEITARADEVIFVPVAPEYLQPLVSVVPLQLLAYHVALLRGCDVDNPRNRAESVTVE